MDHPHYEANLHTIWWFKRSMINTKPNRKLGKYIIVSGIWFLLTYIIQGNVGLGEKYIDRCLEVSRRVGGIFTYWILTQKGVFISRKTVQRLTNL